MVKKNKNRAVRRTATAKRKAAGESLQEKLAKLEAEKQELSRLLQDGGRGPQEVQPEVVPHNHEEAPENLSEALDGDGDGSVIGDSEVEDEEKVDDQE